MIVPETLLLIVQEEAARWNSAFSVFAAPDYVSDTVNRLKRYVEISLKVDHVLHPLFPFLCRFPLGAQVEQVVLTIQDLQSFYQAEASKYRQKDTQSFLNDFIEQKKPALSSEQIQHILDPVVEAIHIPGLYMILKKDSFFDLPFSELKNHLEGVEKELIPQLLLAHDCSRHFSEIEQNYYQAKPPHQSQLLEQLNGVFKHYCQKAYPKMQVSI